MLKYIAPLEQRLRHLPRPALMKSHQGESQSTMTTGQRVAEIAAARIGSWSFLIAQSIFLLIWVICNNISWLPHWDLPGLIILNLVLSFQAAFTGPVLLIAANAGAARDHSQYDRMEAMEKTLLQDNALLRGDIAALHSEIAQLTAQKENAA